MELTHRFTVPADVEETWQAFNDIGSVAECFPGATVTSADDAGFQGSVKVKLGPIALVYNGSGTFTEKDESAHTMKIEAKGKDKRGNGTAGANVTATLTANGDETDVVVLTDLAVTGKPAQFGRGVMQDVSDKLLAQFVECLKTKVGSGPATEPAPIVESSPASPAAPAAAAAASAETQPEAEAPPPVVPSSSPPARSDDALDLGATVLPVLARSYWRQAVAAVVAIVVVIVVVKKLL